MRRPLLFAIAAMLLAVPRQSTAQTTAAPTILGDLLHDWSNMKDTILDIADVMPEEKFGFKPAPDVRTFGEQLLHIAFGNVMSLRASGAKATPPAIDMRATSKDAIVKAVADSFDY